MTAVHCHMYDVFYDKCHVTPVTASLAWSLIDVNDGVLKSLACWWIACKFEETNFDSTCGSVKRMFPRYRKHFGAFNDLCVAERDVLARRDYVLPYKSKMREICHMLNTTKYDKWLHAILMCGFLHLYDAADWVAILQSSDTVTPSVMNILQTFIIGIGVSKRLCQTPSRKRARSVS